ncbi:MAG: HAMP domain-containing histidine kinase [Eubacterium sp.]|nr:HAMP domain-containing histidine kinase [Eubacterium sp.]
MNDIENTSNIKNTYLKLCFSIILILLLIILVVEFVLLKKKDNSVDLYKIEVSRVENDIKGHADIKDYKVDISKYQTILGVYQYDEDDKPDQNSQEDVDTKPDQVVQDKTYESDYNEFLDSSNHYVVKYINGRLYRIEYEVDLSSEMAGFIKSFNLIIGIVMVCIFIIMIYIYIVIIRRFQMIADYPYELAKGNLTIPLKEDKNKYFGHFLWGLDMLREKLEQEKEKNLELQKEKNVFILSLSHDIKTPLAAIKLYAAAMKKKLYKDSDKQTEIAQKIDDNVWEIENYVSKIITSSSDDFINFDVKNEDFYLSELVDYIKKYYIDKLDNIGIDFRVEDYKDLLIKGDKDRFIEVVQNVIENAIKYGDGDKIWLDFGKEEGNLLINISNSGSSLAENELDHIFESFYRGSNVGNRSGSGLGLYICRKLMNKMGGHIYAELNNRTMTVTLVCNT